MKVLAMLDAQNPAQCPITDGAVYFGELGIDSHFMDFLMTDTVRIYLDFSYGEDIDYTDFIYDAFKDGKLPLIILCDTPSEMNVWDDFLRGMKNAH